MDTSETYIKMCEKAREIQAVWHKQGKFISQQEARDGGCKEAVDYYIGLHLENGYDGSFYWDGGCVSCVDYEYESYYKETDVWLPRQDELQDMVIGEYYGLVSMMEQFYHWAIGELERSGFPKTSIEQLWLAFVMKENYNKVWDGENWVKIVEKRS